ncbi:MAG: prolyl oligopeptidase family serine peptidase [Lentisphaerae bacterium]|nr:prolyl oligopeptidase family serine peptidase [Lentisphaerota bacterium]
MASSSFAGDANTVSPKRPPLPIEVFSVAGHKAFLVAATNRAAGEAGPWVWYAPIQGNDDKPGGHLTWMFERFLAAGISVAGMNTAQAYPLYGGPEDRALFTALYDELVRKRGFSRKPCLLAQSRGGFQIYNWAAEHPESVGCIVGIYAAYDAKGWLSFTNIPMNHLEGLANAHVPLFNIHGDADDRVPLEKHPAELHRRYRELGGEATLVVVKGKGHAVLPEYFQSQELVDFVIVHARPDKDADSH